MALNYEFRKKIGGSFDDSNSVMHFATNKDLVEGLLSGGVLSNDIIPDWLKVSSKSGGAITTNKTVYELFTQIKTELGLTALTDLAAAEIMNGGTIYVNATTLEISADNFHQASFIGGDDDGVLMLNDSGVIELERGDKIEFISRTVISDTIDEGWCSLNDPGTPPDFSDAEIYNTEAACTGAGGVWLAAAGSTSFIVFRFSIMNSNYPLATTSTAGIMSAADKTKLDGIATNANNYTPPTDGADKVVSLGGIEKVASITIQSDGRVTAFTTEDIVNASTAAKGVVQLANPATDIEWKTGQSSSKVVTPSLAKTMMDFFAGVKVYNNYATDGATAEAAHPDGAVAIFAV